MAAVLRWQERLECGVGWQENVPHLALGWRNNAWSVGWSLALASKVQTHDVAVSWKWGPSLTARRAQLQQRQNDTIQTQAELAVAVFQTQQLEQWKRFAGEAFDTGDLERAASFFGMVLIAHPDDSDAQAGFKRSRHAIFVTQADSLMHRSDYGGAARALEEALQLAPSDSSSAVRLREVRRASRLAFRQQTDAEQLFRGGIDAFAKQDYLQAMRDFRGVLALDPEHHMASSYLSQADQSLRNRVDGTLQSATQRMQAKDFESARRLVHRLLADEPDQPRALQLLASIDKAEKRALARARAAEEASQRQAATETAQRDAAAAQPTAVEDAAPVAPSEEIMARYEEGIRLYRAGDMMAAMQAWEEVAAQAAHYQDVDGYLLRVYRVAGLERYTEGRLQEAADIWTKALQLDPQNRQLARYLSQVQAKLKRANRPGGGD
jgi:tetratricopeptide (TPR) repeat protein